MLADCEDGDNTDDDDDDDDVMVAVVLWLKVGERAASE